MSVECLSPPNAFENPLLKQSLPPFTPTITSVSKVPALDLQQSWSQVKTLWNALKVGLKQCKQYKQDRRTEGGGRGKRTEVLQGSLC